MGCRHLLDEEHRLDAGVEIGRVCNLEQSFQMVGEAFLLGLGIRIRTIDTGQDGRDEFSLNSSS